MSNTPFVKTTRLPWRPSASRQATASFVLSTRRIRHHLPFRVLASP
jgi:hypothetical protein